MTVPKRRKSHGEVRKRRSQHYLIRPDFSSCPKCGEVKLPHQVCPNCGYYKGRQVLDIEAKKVKKLKREKEKKKEIAETGGK